MKHFIPQGKVNTTSKCLALLASKAIIQEKKAPIKIKLSKRTREGANASVGKDGRSREKGGQKRRKLGR